MPPKRPKRPRIRSKLVQWKDDIDYWDQLSEEEQRWLSREMEEMYGGDPKPRSGKKRKNQSYSDYHGARHDIMNRAILREQLPDADAEGKLRHPGETPEEALLRKEREGITQSYLTAFEQEDNDTEN